MKMNRELQQKVLAHLKDVFPEYVKTFPFEASKEELRPTIKYLEEAGLVEYQCIGALEDRWRTARVKATQRGCDFVEDDGGLTALLGCVTVRLHSDTLKDLIALKIEESDLPKHTQAAWLQALKQLPAESIKHLTLKLLDLALAHGPDALQQVGKFLRILP